MSNVEPRISVIGLGKLGSPLCAVFASKGFHIIGLDLDKKLVDAFQRGEAPVHEPGLQELVSSYKNNIEVTMDYFKAVSETNMTMVIVPTPSDPKTGFFSNEYIHAAVKSIGSVIKSCNKYHQVVIVSTVMPGSTGGTIKAVLESSSGREVGSLDSQVGLAYNPEFIALGQVVKDMLNPDFILIGESDKRIGDALEALYSTVIMKRPLHFHRMNFINAELTKISVNTYVTTKITYANMISELCDNLPGADADIVNAAVGRDSRIGSKYLKGALAYGGPCFPRDNRAFISLAKSISVLPLLADATDRLNEHQVERVIQVCEKVATMRCRSSPQDKMKVGILGLSYKPDTPVVECSPACSIINRLIIDFDVYAYDPIAISAASQICDKRVKFVHSIDAIAQEPKIDLLIITTASPSWKNIIFDRRRTETLYVLDCWRLLNKEELEKTYKHVRIILLGNGDSMFLLRQLGVMDPKYARSTTNGSSKIHRKVRVLVAGGAGFIGSHLCHRLLSEGYYVICADWKRNEYFKEDEICNKFLMIDLRELKNCLMATKGCSWVFNLAADMGGMGYIQSNNSVILFNNTMISFNMIEAARQNGVKRFFYASSACIYPEHIQSEENVSALKEDQAWPARPQDAYGLEKLVSEEIAMHYAKDFYNFEIRIARFHNIYGPRGHWKGGREKAPAALCRKVLVANEGCNNGIVNVWGNGKQTRSFCYIDDCIEGIMRLMQSDYSSPLNIGSDEVISVNDTVMLICEIVGKNVTINHIPGPEGVRGRNSDNTLIKDVLNWVPSTPLKEGLKLTYEFIQRELEKERKNNQGVDLSSYALSEIVSQTTQTLEAMCKRRDS